MGAHVIVTTDPDPWDPDAYCDHCGRRGTVARSLRSDLPASAEKRFCSACWPEQRADQIHRRFAEGARYSNVWRDPALSWQGLLDLVAAVERVLPLQAADGSREQQRATGVRAVLAWELRQLATRLKDPMPAAVRDFIDRNPRPAGQRGDP